MPEFPAVVVIDQREKLPFAFAAVRADAKEGGGILTVRTVTGHLPTGDYSLVGLESEVAVERKGIEDLFSTIGQHRDRFERELARLNAMRCAWVVIESDLAAILGTPPARSMLPPKTVIRSMMAWQVRYPRVHWWPCSDRSVAESVTLRLLQRYMKERERELANVETQTQ